VRLLHAIANVGTTATIWAYVMGGNGQPLGRTLTLAHLYPVTRTPVPARSQLNLARRYYSPWGDMVSRMTTEQRLTPLCGRIRTQARYPRFNTISEYNNWTTHCPTCERTTTGTYLNVLNTNDPWNIMRNQQYEVPNWWEAPDPVTGL
jgi:hypothetical protein